ncbi:hypothetical protein F4781DRAFT_436226 [Annulohypoxylon bovei var. microspora]|nr:hypothetical protein F4781DRAFT_436226 [Annulohypoxylon bovei var. microspora]
MSAMSTELPPGYEEANRAPSLRAFFIVMTVMAVFSISMRFWSRGLTPKQTRQQHRFWLDDWFALAAVPWILAQLSVSFVALGEGFGRHAAVLDIPDLLHVAKNIFVIYFLYDAGLFLTKESALLFLRRIFPAHASPAWFNRSLWIGHVLNVAWIIGIFFGTLFMCNPIEKNWNTSVPGYCGSTSGLFIGSAVPSVFIDLFILLLPVPRILSLQMNSARKFGVIIVFVLGYCVVIVSLGRLVTVLKSIDALNTDITYAGVPVVYWVTAEPAISLLGVCLPAMLPLGNHLAKNYFTPIASKISVVLSSRRSDDSRLGSVSGNFEGVAVEYNSKSRGTKNSPPSIDTTHVDAPYDMQSLNSTSSRRSILRVSPYQDQYKAHVQGGEDQASGNLYGVPNHGIRVDSDVHVN